MAGDGSQKYGVGSFINGNDCRAMRTNGPYKFCALPVIPKISDNGDGREVTYDESSCEYGTIGEINGCRCYICMLGSPKQG